MPMQETGLPVGATALKVTVNGQDYPLLIDTDTFDRAGEDGDIPIIPLCRGDEYVGEVLEGQWKKGWDSDMSVFTAHIDTEILELSGVSDNPGVDGGYGWIDGSHPIILMNDAEITVAMELPTDDTDGEVIRYSFFITKDKIVSLPNSEHDYIRIWLDVTTAGMIFYIQENIANTTDLLFSGSTYDDTTVRDTGTGLSTIWRIVIHDGVAGATSPEDVRHMHIYLKQGANLAAAEAATENELSNSPYDISAYLFNVGYPAYSIYTMDAVYFGTAIDSGDEALSAYLRVNYSSLFSLKYDFADVDVGKGDVELWDGDPDVSTSVRVFDEDHVFTHDPYLQNGLVRLHVDEAIEYGLKLYGYYGASWNQPFDQIWFNAVTDNEDLRWPVLRYIESVSPEKTAIMVRLLESNTIDDDYYIDMRITLERGKLSLKLDRLDVYPDQDVKFWFLDTTTVRFGYVGDDELGDDDIGGDGDNTTMTDNFLVAFDDGGDVVLGVVYTDEIPAGSVTPSFFAEDGGDLIIDSVAVADIEATSIWIGLAPYSLIHNIFLCAVLAALDGGADTATPGVGNFCSPVIRLDAQNEGAHWVRIAGTQLLAGRYLAVIRDYAVGGVQNYDARVYNNDDSEYRNEEGEYVTFQAQNAAWTYRFLVFDITDADVTGTEDLYIQVLQPNAGPNTVYIDYALIIPICNGMSWPQDLAHAAMRNFNKPKRLYVR